jgi:dephospho-CoA kinase
MLRVGLTGGLATGKSFVGEALVSLGCHLIRADELGHQVLQPGGAAYEDTVREFGSDILEESGAIDRRKLAAKVFGDPDRLAVLNQFVHPAVISLEEEWFARVSSANPGGIAVVEAAILIETGNYTRFDKLILTLCKPEQQVERAMRRGLTREEALARLARQMPLEEKRKFADYVIDTSGTKDNTLEQTRAVYGSLRSLTV